MKLAQVYLGLVRAKLIVPAIVLACAWQAQAVHWTLTSAGPTTWTYTLTFDPFDNCDITTSPTTVTMTGLSGVTAAGAPTSTDFPAGGLTTSMLNWTPSVQNGGTKVVWSNPTCGTGNFGVAKHVFGFTITAAGAQNGTVSYATSGMQVDGPGAILDISGSIAGPSATGTPSVPAASDLTLLLMTVGLAVAGGYQVKQGMKDRMQGGA